MERYDQLYRLYDEYDAATLRALQNFVDLFPPVDSRVALEHWQEASDELDDRKAEVREAFPETGETFCDLAARATRDQAFTALDLYAKYDRGVNVLVLDVDETLRSAGGTDNEIPRETLHLLTEFHEEGLPIVVCTGQTLENVKGFLIQGLGNEIVHSGNLSVVYEAGTGVFTPGHGADTKRLLYDDLDRDVRAIFDAVRSRILSEAPERLRRGCHLQGNEFNVTLKPNFETGSDEAREVIDRALVYELDLLGSAVAEEVEPETEEVGVLESGEGDDEEATPDADAARDWARAYYAAQDPEIRGVLESEGGTPDCDAEDVPGPIRETFERIDVAYYEADAAEIGSLELNKVVGVESAFDVLGIDDPFAAVMGDSKSDLRVMEWVADEEAGIAAAPEHSSRDVLDHVIRTDELVFDRGKAGDVLRTIYALNRLANLG
ncbi:HAD family hydrolase [Halorussus salinus]|uniref:HAD family hydrolase n=1 Tax=Halorussus salinus TaxID=1364935 RepID=UPI001091E50D|nr:HAD family hydrolase [Halorussus salinus]